MKKIIFALLLLSASQADCQNLLLTKTGKISFFSRAKSIDKVEAENNEVSSILNTQTGEMVFAVLIKGFHFESALMEEHFNENYLESGKFPKASFKGNITNLSTVNFTKDGTYPVTAQGDLTIHGVTKKTSATGSITVKGGKVNAFSRFAVKLKDYNITIPSLVADKISEDIDVTVDCKYEPKN